eukprot:7257913-Alexandrium_andersonii.AAC.1
MVITEGEVERALMGLVDWAANKFSRCPQASFTVLAAAIALDTAVPCDHLTVGAWRNLHWKSGQPRFRV